VPDYLNSLENLMNFHDDLDDAYLRYEPRPWKDALASLALVVLCALTVL
jgi:hypothetical protein